MIENDIDSELLSLRRELHREPELSDHEQATAARLTRWLAPRAPDRLVGGLGGHGLAAIFRGAAPGPRVLLRAELDGLPIDERLELEHASSRPGVSHKCGHDGHMAILAGLARRLARQRPAAGEVVLLFQPAEETGQGARRVLDDPAFAGLEPDWAFALHNLPGFELGRVVLRVGPFAPASVGLQIDLEGATAHAGEPQRGRSPALALAYLIQACSGLPQTACGLDQPAKATVVHARLGEPALGTAPGRARLVVTLRAEDPVVLGRLQERGLALADAAARADGLGLQTDWLEYFPATVNHPEAVETVRGAAAAAGLETEEPPAPMAWSEDFGHFSSPRRGALVGLGAGLTQPALHHPDYDFPDRLLAPGVRLLEALVDRLCAGD